MTVYKYAAQYVRTGQPSAYLRRKVVEAGFDTPEKISEWAAKRGLLSVYITTVEVSPRTMAWQVLKHNSFTDPEDVRYGGNKTFLIGHQRYSSIVLQQAMDWSSFTYDVDIWKKPIYASAWFPASTVSSLKLWLGIKRGRKSSDSAK